MEAGMKTLLVFVITASAALVAQGQKAEAMSDAKYGKAEDVRALPASRLAELLRDANASEYAKAKACQRLAVIGDRTVVPALAGLLMDERLSVYARTALEQVPGPEADQALRSALSQLSGKQLIGVINSIAVRRDVKAIDELSRLYRSPDLAVSKAAETALARIRPPL
jgi:HEAT repeat protein